MVYIVDIGFIAFIVIILLMMLGGAALNIVEWLVANIATVLIICIVFAALIFVLTFFINLKKLLPAIMSIIYSSQLSFMVVYGLYQLGLTIDESFFKGLLLVFVYGFYVFFNFLGGSLVILETSEYTDYDNVAGVASFCIGGLGVIGWIINLIVFL